jgi:hypothetical protein
MKERGADLKMKKLMREERKEMNQKTRDWEGGQKKNKKKRRMNEKLKQGRHGP